MFIQGGRGRWGVISGDLENSPAPVTFGEERGDIRVLWNSPTTLVYWSGWTHRRRWLWRGARGYQGVLELTGAGDFGEEREDIIVLTLLNPPVPVTLGDLEQRDKIVSFDKRKVCINPTNTTYFCWHFHSIFAQTYFLFAFVEKKHVAVGLIGNKFSRQFRKKMWFSKSPAPVTCIIIYVFATGECTG